MMNSEKAIRILKEEGCSKKVIKHCKAVSKKSMELAQNIKEEGKEINLQLVKIGSLLHDIGRSKTHNISHGVKGAEILEKRNLKKIANFAKNHIGSGIDIEESNNLDIPEDNYLPKTLEEKVVTYADNLVAGDEYISYEEALRELEEDLGKGHPSVKRFQSLHSELRELGAFEK